MASSKKQISFLRKRVLREWRGLPSESIPDSQVIISDLLIKVVTKLGLNKRIKQEEIAAAWSELVGAFLAEHSEPQQLSHGILSVRVIQPTVRYELDRVWKKEVLQKLQARFGETLIRDVRFGC
jgi:predicted nucleic acid-binding Zn ribbon protein